MKIYCKDCGKDITNGSGSKHWDKYNQTLWPNKKQFWLCAKCHESYIVGRLFIPGKRLKNKGE